MPGWDADLDLAARAALETGFVFTLDRFDQGLILLEERLRDQGIELRCQLYPPKCLPQRIGSSDRFDAFLGPDLHQALIEANALDYELLEQVRAVVDRRYSRSTPPGPAWRRFASAVNGSARHPSDRPSESPGSPTGSWCRTEGPLVDGH